MDSGLRRAVCPKSAGAHVPHYFLNLPALASRSLVNKLPPVGVATSKPAPNSLCTDLDMAGWWLLLLRNSGPVRMPLLSHKSGSDDFAMNGVDRSWRPASDAVGFGC